MNDKKHKDEADIMGEELESAMKACEKVATSLMFGTKNSIYAKTMNTCRPSRLYKKLGL